MSNHYRIRVYAHYKTVDTKTKVLELLKQEYELDIEREAPNLFDLTIDVESDSLYRELEELVPRLQAQEIVEGYVDAYAFVQSIVLHDKDLHLKGWKT